MINKYEKLMNTAKRQMTFTSVHYESGCREVYIICRHDDVW